MKKTIIYFCVSFLLVFCISCSGDTDVFNENSGEVVTRSIYEPNAPDGDGHSTGAGTWVTLNDGSLQYGFSKQGYVINGVSYKVQAVLNKNSNEYTIKSISVTAQSAINDPKYMLTRISDKSFDGSIFSFTIEAVYDDGASKTQLSNLVIYTQTYSYTL